MPFGVSHPLMAFALDPKNQGFFNKIYGEPKQMKCFLCDKVSVSHGNNAQPFCKENRQELVCDECNGLVLQTRQHLGERGGHPYKSTVPQGCLDTARRFAKRTGTPDCVEAHFDSITDENRAKLLAKNTASLIKGWGRDPFTFIINVLGKRTVYKWNWITKELKEQKEYEASTSPAETSAPTRETKQTKTQSKRAGRFRDCGSNM